MCSVAYIAPMRLLSATIVAIIMTLMPSLAPAGFVSSQGYAGGKTGRWIQTHGRGGFTYSISIRRL